MCESFCAFITVSAVWAIQRLRPVCYLAQPFTKDPPPHRQVPSFEVWHVLAIIECFRRLLLLYCCNYCRPIMTPSFVKQRRLWHSQLNVSRVDSTCCWRLLFPDIRIIIICSILIGYFPCSSYAQFLIDLMWPRTASRAKPILCSHQNSGKISSLHEINQQIIHVIIIIILIVWEQQHGFDNCRFGLNSSKLLWIIRFVFEQNK